ncbi:MAG: radical SAM protein [Hyphomicrobiales bacterium]
MRLEIAVIELTNDCNLRCKHCYGHFENNTIISKYDFERIINQIYNLGCTQIILSGGEPMLLGNKLIDYVKIAKKKGFPFVALTTNGTLNITDQQELLKYLDMIQISIDGLKETHNNIRGKGTFQKALSFIKENSNDSCKISLMMSVHKDNYNEVKEVHKLSKELNAEFAIEIVTPCGRGNSINILSKEELKVLKDFIITENINCNDPISFCENDNISLFNNTFKVGCSAGTSALCIDAHMNVFPCVRLRLNLGNLKEKTLDDIIKNKIIRDLDDRNLLKGNCGKCLNKFICGGCRARAFALTNDYLEGDELCIDFKEITKSLI